MSAIDDARAALRAISTDADATAAVAVATIALAEEQRTANLIAWYDVLADTDAVDEASEVSRLVAVRLDLTS